jgi:hypothetical protein
VCGYMHAYCFLRIRPVTSGYATTCSIQTIRSFHLHLDYTKTSEFWWCFWQIMASTMSCALIFSLHSFPQKEAECTYPCVSQSGILRVISSSEVGSCSAGQDITCLLLNPKVRYCVHKGPPQGPVLNQMIPVHNLFIRVHHRTLFWISLYQFTTYSQGSTTGPCFESVDTNPQPIHKGPPQDSVLNQLIPVHSLFTRVHHRTLFWISWYQSTTYSQWSTTGPCFESVDTSPQPIRKGPPQDSVLNQLIPVHNLFLHHQGDDGGMCSQVSSYFL